MGKYILPNKFLPLDTQGGETGHDWICCRVTTIDGKIFKNVVVHARDEIVAVYGYNDLPFDINSIKKIEVTHRKDYPSDFKGFKTFDENRAIK